MRKTYRLNAEQWELVNEGRKIAYWQIQRHLQPGESADDIWDAGIQDVLIRCAYRFDPSRGKWSTLVCNAVYRATLQAREKLRREGSRFVYMPACFDARCNKRTPIELAAALDDIARVRHTVSTLKPRWREALERVELEGETLEHAARAMGITRERVRQVIIRAKVQLRQRLMASYPHEAKLNREVEYVGQESK